MSLKSTLTLKKKKKSGETGNMGQRFKNSFLPAEGDLVEKDERKNRKVYSAAW